MDLPEALATIDLLRGHIAALGAQLSARDAVIQQQQHEFVLRDCQIARLQRMHSGDRSEKLAPEELTLPGVDLAVPSVPMKVRQSKA